MNNSIRELLCGMGYEDSIVFDNPDYDEAIMGVTHNGNVVDEMVRRLMEQDNMSEEGAADFISYNTIRSIPYAGECAPVVMYRLYD